MIPYYFFFIRLGNHCRPSYKIFLREFSPFKVVIYIALFYPPTHFKGKMGSGEGSQEVKSVDNNNLSLVNTDATGTNRVCKEARKKSGQTRLNEKVDLVLYCIPLP